MSLSLTHTSAWTILPLVKRMTRAGLRLVGLKTVCLLLSPAVAQAQGGGYAMQGDYKDYNTAYMSEAGIEGGVATYFGDLNTTSSFRALKPAVGIFYRFFFNNYIGASAHLHYAQLGFSDRYNQNEFQHLRNLSFNSDLWEFTLQGDFNFFQFEPGSRAHRFTPYLTFGIGAIHFNPYAYLDDQRYDLQPLGTEGQGSSLYPHRKKYALWTWDVPLGFGVKYNLNPSWNVMATATHHFTGTDYLDDVSTTYAGPAAFMPKADGTPSVASQLQDRSQALGKPIGEAGRQRGNSRDKDQFMYIEISFAYLFSKYHCPPY